MADRRARAHGLGPDQEPCARHAAALGLEGRAAAGYCPCLNAATDRRRLGWSRREGKAGQKREHWLRSLSPLLVIVEVRVLRRRLADLLHHARVGGPRLLLPQPDQLDLELPLVAVVEEEEHL